MTTDHILALLISERDKITGAIEALQGTSTDEMPGAGRKAILSIEQDSKAPKTVGPTAPVKRKLSAAGRRAIIAATKKRWAAIKAAKAAAAAPATKAPLAKAPNAAPPTASGAAKHKSSAAKDAAFRKKMSATMKKAWAARKKKAAAKAK